ncbi:UxaA family hydrolase [Mucilaginibacter sp. Mucisp86]|uniref:UxaA family hydrolase n=1 Tax=Mucilaginibacter sp. Mucisp86 TaxID=3243060 RepID=UPI0039B505D1
MQNSLQTFMQIHRDDNVLVALTDLKKGTAISFGGSDLYLITNVPAKHKFTIRDLQCGDAVYMYGVLVGLATEVIPRGTAITTGNIKHAANGFRLGERHLSWQKPDVSAWISRTFMGYIRDDGAVGTANYWLVVPLVFCENRNVKVLSDAFLDQLGYSRPSAYVADVQQLIDFYRAGYTPEQILETAPIFTEQNHGRPRLFQNVDGIKFLTHELGCGGTRLDSDALCGLLAGYITHPNVAGATVLSLGCQHAQADILKREISKRDRNFNKPLVILEQQNEGTEKRLLKKATVQTFVGLMQVNLTSRSPAPLSKLCIGLECGASDGFSGISANPALGYVSDIIVALGGSVILAEFPELCGVEQNLSDRCINNEIAERFMNLMTIYNRKAEESGSGFHANPSPGNIRDGLITDAIKSAGAAKKGGISPVVDVLDYPGKVKEPGLNLLCTPGNDVESTTAEVAAGANIVLFTTGLGTPTGNPVTPVIKLSTNTATFRKMPDIIDINCGTIIEGTETIEQSAERILEYIIQVASGDIQPKAVLLGQDDFIPWKRGVSL